MNENGMKKVYKNGVKNKNQLHKKEKTNDTNNEKMASKKLVK